MGGTIYRKSRLRLQRDKKLRGRLRSRRSCERDCQERRPILPRLRSDCYRTIPGPECVALRQYSQEPTRLNLLDLQFLEGRCLCHEEFPPRYTIWLNLRPLQYHFDRWPRHQSDAVLWPGYNGWNLTSDGSDGGLCVHCCGWFFSHR